MKKTACALGFSLIYGLLLSWVIECVLNGYGYSFALTPDGASSQAFYSAVILLCWAAALAGLAVLAVLLMGNWKLACRLGFGEGLWCLEIFASAGVAFFTVKLWEGLFDCLRSLW